MCRGLFLTVTRLLHNVEVTNSLGHVGLVGKMRQSECSAFILITSKMH